MWSRKQATVAAEECLISRSTSSSGASAPRWRIGRCAKRKPSGDGCENERSQVRYTRLSRVNFSLKPDFIRMFINYGARFLPRFFFLGQQTNEDCNLRIETKKKWQMFRQKYYKWRVSSFESRKWINFFILSAMRIFPLLLRNY